jgi:PAS domain S-box-containing protein
MKKTKSDQNINESEYHSTKRLFDYSTDMMCVAGFDGYFKLLNPAWTKTLGWSSEELMSKPRIDYVHPDDIDNTQNVNSEIIDGEEVYKFENRYRCKNGDYKWLSWSSYPSPGEEIMFGVARDVTASKAAEEEMAKTFEKFNFLGLHLDGVLYQFRLDPDGSFHLPYVSPSIEKIYGISPADVKENPDFILDIIHPDDLDGFLDSIQISAVTLEKWQEIYRVILQDGRMLWIEGNATPQKLEDGSILWHGYIQDITVRKDAELENKKLTTAIEQNPASIIITDIDGRIEYVNPSFVNLTGFTFDEARGEKPNILKSGDHTDEFYRNLWDTISSGKIWKGNMFNRKKNGELYWESAIISPVLDNEGQIMNYLSIKEDITQSLAAETKIKDSELYHRTLLQSIPDMVFVLNDEGTFLDFKTSHNDDLYSDPDAFINNDIRNIMPDKVVQKIMAAVLQCLNTEQTLTFEYSLVIKNSTRFFSANMVSFGNRKVITTVRNITEYRNNLDQIQDLLDIEEKQNESLHTFTHIVSHNLRIHTANMLGILMLLEMEDTKTFENQFVQLLKESSINLEETIGHLIEVLEIKLEKEKNFEKTNLLETVRKAISGLQYSANKNDVRQVIDIPEDITVNVVPSYLDNIILHLLDNGIRYCDKTKDSYVRISSIIEDDYTIIIIKDNGVGLDLEMYGEQLFDMYKKFHDKSTSNGLGLFMTKNQVEAMGGHIEVESELTKGTTFKVYLPNKNE